MSNEEKSRQNIGANSKNIRRRHRNPYKKTVSKKPGNYSQDISSQHQITKNVPKSPVAAYEDKLLGDINSNTGKDNRYRPAPVSKTPQLRPQIARGGEDVLKIIPIGGCEEVGRNMTVFEYRGDIVILDMGIQFPEEDMPGIDYIIPNSDYLKGREKNIRAVIFSHGHLDHIGAAPILLEKLGYPTVIGMNMTLAMIKHRLEDYKKDSSKKLKTIVINKISDRLKLGAFQVGFFQIEHSIMDAVGVILRTPPGTVIHPGDWTMERNNNNQPLVDYKHLASLPSPKILMLESLGAINFKPSTNSEEMKKNLRKIIAEAPGRLIIGTFSSQIERIGWIISMVQELGKKVALDGYSMKMNVEIAQKLGYIKAGKGTIIKTEQLADYPDNKVVVLCTGAQGESNAVLSRIIDGSHRSIKLRKNDTVVLSSSIIPGNERTIQRLKDNLYRQCDNVIHGNLMDIHISGHGNRDDIIYILNTVKPDYYIPVYANHYILKEAEKLALASGFKKDKIFVPNNGTIIEFSKKGGYISTKKAVTDYVFVDGLGISDSHNVILRDRQMMAEDGMLVIIATISRKTGELIHNPDLISRGFVYMKENKKLIEMTRQKAKKILKDHSSKTSPDEQIIREKLRNEIGKFLFQKTEKRPMILPVIIEV
ncbi:MAG: ribonuclease J [Candidatus Buchananbacteria bacterium]|nr:ribonuclease J [Candidatus Buchananbacteria bacterium]